MIQDFLPVLNIVLVIALAVGGLIAFRRGYSKEIGEIQERTVTALKEEVAVLRAKVDDLVAERAVQDKTIATIRYALKEYGLRVLISGDFVTLQDLTGTRKTTTPIKSKAIIKPIIPSDDDNDDVS
jgi:hypothetical protein